MLIGMGLCHKHPVAHLAGDTSDRTHGDGIHVRIHVGVRVRIDVGIHVGVHDGIHGDDWVLIQA